MPENTGGNVRLNEGLDVDGMAHEIWAAAVLAPGEGIEDAVARIKAILELEWKKPTIHHDVEKYFDDV